MYHDTQGACAPKVSIVTLGCPMNQVDSERILSGLLERGFTLVPEDEADVIVVNTCGFIESAREESIGTIMSVAGLKDRGNLKALVVAGCLAERYKYELENELPEADAVIGLADIASIPDRCCELLGSDHGAETHRSRVVIGSPNTAYLKIAEGCDNRCAYCTIPMIRGPFRSVPSETVLAEARELAGLGRKELVLIGQDTTSYGTDLGNGLTLSRLLERLNDIEGVEWIRVMYTHPAHFSEELIEAFVRLPKVLPYIDIPVQHIAAPVLERMGRCIAPGQIRRLLESLRERIRGLVLRTSLITGFPGETDGDFRELLSFVSDVRFERLGAFVYSREEGTRAALLDGQVPEAIARERYRELMALQEGLSAEFQRSLVGREFNMIVDALDSNGGAIGRIYSDAPEIDGNVSVPRGVQKGVPFCRIRITAAGTYDLTAEPV